MQSTVSLPNLEIRSLNENDSIADINALLLAAYRPLAEAGMKYAASHEDVHATRRNIEDGRCYLAILDLRIVACAVLRIPDQEKKDGWKSISPGWYRKPGVTTFGRFAVSPELQRSGVGSRMMDTLEDEAKKLGFKELALDTSEHAQHLISMYEKRGYRFIEFHQWNITNYRSVVMSKVL